MSQPAARITDMHVCPMVDGVKPHIGGPISGPSVSNVLIGGMPAAVVGDMCTCTGPPDVIVQGSTNVLIGGRPAARMGDSTAHGGKIILGCVTVLIGTGSGGTTPLSMVWGNKQNQAQSWQSLKQQHNEQSLKEAAATNNNTADRKIKDDYSAQFILKDGEQQPLQNVAYEVTMDDGHKYKGKTDASGQTQKIEGYATGNGTILFQKK